LLKALVACGRDDLLSQVIDFVRQTPREFNLDDHQVPCLKSLVPWSQKQFGRVSPAVAGWLDGVRAQLESAVARPPSPPTTWARPAEVACSCSYCSQLKSFLADPANETARIKAAEGSRHHVSMIIDRHQCDVAYAEERKGSPYSLVLTKTTGSYDRAVERFKADQQLLNALPTVE
jgi:hypothetical protein